ncbi:HAMP domain-containing sensor histidine kinase [Paenibacillus sp. KS-LC4]|uniref:sensor histidine kinase n=1 Tax=Paenibacillus sp. KS-LC4 TaxID=2979727 RepID=UPI0030CE8A13
MKSLYSRVFLVAMAVIIGSSFLGFLVSNLYYHHKLKPYNDAKLTRIALQMQQFAEDQPELAAAYLANAAELGYEILLADGQGTERYFGRAFREKELADDVLRNVLAGGQYHGIAQFPNQLFITGFFDNMLSNTVGVPLQLEGKRYALFIRPDVILQFGELRSFFAMIGLLTVAFSLLCFLLSTRYLVKPVTRLTEATQRIAQGNYALSLNTKRRDEIGRLAAHFMTMSQELERVEQARQEFVANVSHEIQSPLTSIQGFAHALAEKELPTDERAHYAAIIGEESRRLAALTKELLLLSSLDQAAEALQRKPFNLRAQLRQVAQVMEWQLTEKEIALKIAVPSSLMLDGDEMLLYQVWMNLLSNAAKYIPSGRAIEVEGKLERGRCVIRVTDTGDGIGREQLPFLFDRFYRADRARERGTEGGFPPNNRSGDSVGSGLGLAITQKIVHLHNGTIEAASEPGQGTTFTVTLPQL